MPRLARLLGFLRREQPIPLEETIYEVSEHRGALLVRLRGGSVMQLRLQPDRTTVLIRTVPLTKAKQLEDDLPWQAAPESQIEEWLHSDSAMGQWLVAKGLADERLASLSLR